MNLEKKIVMLKKEIEYYSKVFNPNCKKVKELKEKLATVTSLKSS